MHKEESLQTLGQKQRILKWSQRVADCRQSGLSVKQWCSENGTSVKTYYSWQKKAFEFMVEQQMLRLDTEEHRLMFARKAIDTFRAATKVLNFAYKEHR